MYPVSYVPTTLPHGPPQPPPKPMTTPARNTHTPPDQHSTQRQHPPPASKP